MKKALIAACFALTLSLFGHDSIKNRFYLDSADIKILPEGLFLVLEDGLLPIEIAGQDERGAFITTPRNSKTVVCVVCDLEFDPNERAAYCPHPLFK